MARKFHSVHRSGSPKGVLLLGTEFSCGKTSVAAGLAAALQDEGYQARAAKPLCLGPQISVASELEFLARVGRSPVDYPVALSPEPAGLPVEHVRAALDWCRYQKEFIFLEMPGSCATPLCWIEDQSTFWQDCADFARELSWPAVIVGRFGPRSIEQFMLAATYLRRKQVQPLAMVAVQTSPGLGRDAVDPDLLALALEKRCGVPYLGCIPYSPSISVPQVNQGNLFKSIAANIDLLPLLKSLCLELPPGRIAGVI